MLEAKDGRKQAHMDVLVAVFGSTHAHCSARKTPRLQTKKRATPKGAALLQPS